VIIGFPVIPAHFDPLRTVADGHTGGLLLFSTLVDTDADMNIIPDLAESYRISEDGLTYTFKLRRDARFTDGVGVTAADVVFSYQRVMNNATATDLTMVKQVAADGDEVIINLSKPWSPFLLTVAQVGIVPEHAYGPDFGLNPIGSGPFKLVQLDVEQQFILEANEEYYGKIPEIKRFVFVKMSNEDIQFAAAKSGQVDITLTSAVLAAVNDIPGYKLLIKDSLDNMGLAMPTIPDTRVVNRYGRSVGNNITHQVSFRQALAYGLDREAICRDALNGFATPAYTENDGMPWSNPDSKIDYDLDYAIALLEGDGWLPGSDGIRTKEGLRASLPLIYSAGDSVRQAVAMAVAKQAKEKLGIELVVEGTSWDDISLRMYSEPLILAWGSANPMTSYYLFHSSRAGLDDFYNPQNFTSVHNESINQHKLYTSANFEP